MKLCDVGWVWEGQGLDPGVHPSIFGVGEGAEYFGLRKVHFMFHPTNELALEKLSAMDEVICDVSKWCFKDTENGGSDHYVDASVERVCREAEDLSRLSLKFDNITGGFFDDMKGLMLREGHGHTSCAQVRDALRAHNDRLELEAVVYSRELDQPEFWEPLIPYVDIVSFWVWGYPHLEDLERDLDRCRALFEGKPIRMGCYLRDYPSAAPMPMDAMRHQWDVVVKALGDGRITGFDVLGTVLIDGHQEQARFVRDFIRDRS
ncbi:MAG: hypothetical protein GY851_09840 [bacterium]|nr:hypothetical protein [bacterium]